MSHSNITNTLITQYTIQIRSKIALPRTYLYKLHNIYKIVIRHVTTSRFNNNKSSKCNTYINFKFLTIQAMRIKYQLNLTILKLVKVRHVLDVLDVDMSLLSIM